MDRHSGSNAETSRHTTNMLVFDSTRRNGETDLFVYRYPTGWRHFFRSKAKIMVYCFKCLGIRVGVRPGVTVSLVLWAG